jgi:hypothetical protein
MMESTSTPTTTSCQQVVVDVPEDRVAEFHALFARFLARPVGRGRRGRRGKPLEHRGHRGRHCRAHHESVEPSTERSTEATEPETRPTTEL